MLASCNHAFNPAKLMETPALPLETNGRRVSSLVLQLRVLSHHSSD